MSAIRDDVLHTSAVDGLSRGDESVSALACRLGFSEPSAFTRAFRRWTGESQRHTSADEVRSADHGRHVNVASFPIAIAQSQED